MKIYSVTLALVLALAGCGSAPEAHDHEAEHEVAAHTDGSVKFSTNGLTIAKVKTVAARAEWVQAEISSPGTVRATPTGRAVVTSPMAGQVVAIDVQLGQQVTKGQTLARVESPDLAEVWSSIAAAKSLQATAEADLRQSRAEHALAEAKRSSAQQNLARQRELVRAGAFSQAPVQAAQSELNEAQSELLSGQKEQLSHAEQLQRLESLFRDGIVSKSELEASRLELQQDRIRLDRAQAKIELAKATYDRERNIAERGLLNARELQTAEAEVRASGLELRRAAIRVQSAAAALARAGKSVASAESIYQSHVGTGRGTVGQVALVAPIAGKITHLDVTRGQSVERTQVLLEVEDLRSVWVTANVPESDATKVRTGAAVRVTSGGREFAGVVQVLGASVDAKTRSLPTQCLVVAQEQLRPGMFATVQVSVGPRFRSVVVPKTAIVMEGGEAGVFVQNGSAFVRRAVKLGMESGPMVAVVSGVRVGEVVASEGAFVLASEAKKSDLKGHDH